ncbi:MAG: 30S ribosomal protein S1 [Candidatus Dependentiae bacterium ADurb.Bin331]|nr:MAG: 30S ribosomal protein S1 [Candidatus Dependentiae bacterium ADurb.Bin331]
MSKEITKPQQFCKVQTQWADDESAQFNQEQKDLLASLYEGEISKLSQGKIVTGRVIKADNDGVLVDIGFKSYGLIPPYEFSKLDLQKITPGSDIEVMLEDLENVDGNVSLSYEQAKAMRAWDTIMKLFEEGKPVEGIVTHKVKGGLSVDIGIPAFLPGSQVDLQRVADFDQFVGQPITAYIIKVNKKRGNVIISRRKFLNELRSESRKKILGTLSENQIIQGIVKNITNYGVFIDIGGVDGLLHITDMTWGRIAHPSELVRIGDKITVKVLSFDKDNEKISLGMKQLTENPWDKVAEGLTLGSKVKGKISSITDYGFFVEIQKGVEGLVHISEISWTDRIDNLHKHFKPGDEIEAVIVSIDKDNRRMSLSIKQLQDNPWKQVSDRFKVGQIVKGPITNITDFGVFIQLMPGIDGLVHISDLSWTEHIAHPADVFKRGQEVEAVILGIDEQNKRVSLGIKQLTPDPWATIELSYPVGSTVEGEVSKIINFGAFVKLPNGIEGLVHISELSDQNVEKVEDVLKVGQKRQFRVIKISKEDHKLGLSLKTNDFVPEKTKEKTSSAPKRGPVKTKSEEMAAKPKSLLQIELEKHAARQKTAADEQANEDKE